MKAIFLPEITKNKTDYFIKYENIPLAQISNSIIYFKFKEKKLKRIKTFYEKFFSKYEAWINKDFYTFVIQDYIADTNPRKRFRYKTFTLELSMNSKFVFDRFLKVDIHVTLAKSKNLINKKQLTHVWDLRTGNLQLNKHKKR